MTTIKLIALDMDGTLLNDEEMVTDYTREVIHQAISQGVQVVLSTGRPLETCISYAEDLQLSSYLITSNGAEIFDKNQTLVEQHVMEPDIIEKMWSIAHEHNIDTW